VEEWKELRILDCGFRISWKQEKQAAVSTQYADVAKGRSVEPNCIRLEKTCQGLENLAESVKEA